MSIQELVDPKVIILKGHYFLLAVKPGKTFSVFLSSLDFEKDQAGPYKEILHSDTEAKWFVENLKIYYPADSARALIAMEYIISKKGNQQFADVLIDSEGNKIWDKYFDIPVTGEFPNFFGTENKHEFSQAVSNAGDAYIVYQKENSFDAVLIHIDKTGNKSEFPFQLAVSRIIDAAIILNGRQQLYYGGLYKNATEMLEGAVFHFVGSINGCSRRPSVKTLRQGTGGEIISG